MKRTRSLHWALLALIMAILALAPGVVHATGVRPASVYPDPWEPDDTTATARALRPYSIHTFSHMGTTTQDVDWSVISAFTTGTPIFVETNWSSGWILPMPTIFVEDPAAPGGISPVPAAGVAWGGLATEESLLVRAPKPGRYYVRVTNASTPYSAGAYGFTERRAIAKRIAGANRFETAGEVSRQMWPDIGSDGIDSLISNTRAYPLSSPAGVILTTGRGFADALAASAWINGARLPQDRMPILLTERDWLPASTSREIRRLAEARRETNSPFTVYVIGRGNVVSEDVITQLYELGDERSPWAAPVTHVVRIFGDNRFGTAAAIAAREASGVGGIGDTVFIANGFSFADALAAGPVAGAGHAPLLLVEASAIPSETAAFLTTHPAVKKAVIVGSSAVVSDGVISALATAPFSLDTTRVAGPNRFKTAEALARFGVANFGMNGHGLVVVTGNDYPDGLAASGLTAFTHTPLLLTPRNDLSSAITSFTADFELTHPSFVVGGLSAVTFKVENRWNFANHGDAVEEMPVVGP